MARMTKRPVRQRDHSISKDAIVAKDRGGSTKRALRTLRATCEQLSCEPKLVTPSNDKWRSAMSTPNVAHLIIETLREAGIRRIFGVVGDSLNGITEALRQSG